MSKPFEFTSGPHDAKLVLLGEAFGEQEEQHGKPFAGQSGRELFRMLGDAWSDPSARELANIRSDQEWLREREGWLQREGILLTNVFALRPSKNNLGALCGLKGELEDGYNLPAVRTENPRFVRSEIAVPELQRLSRELSAHPRNLLLCLGATALWALTGSAAIGSLRGAVGEGGVLEVTGACEPPTLRGGNASGAGGEAFPSAVGGECGAGAARGAADSPAADRETIAVHGGVELDGGRGVQVSRGLLGQAAEAVEAAHSSPARFKLLPTYHPAAVLRAWHWRPIVLADLLKGDRERRNREILRPARRIVISPSIGEVEEWTRRALEGDSTSPPATLLSPDIETLNGQIRCIGFARSVSDVLVVPFVARLSGGSYWGDEGDELRAWACVRALLESEIPKVGQNFLFDMQYLTRVGIKCRNVKHDTMLLHHALHPELQKGLGFLASVYCNEFAYKLLRRHKGEEELKRDE